MEFKNKFYGEYIKLMVKEEAVEELLRILGESELRENELVKQYERSADKATAESWRNRQLKIADKHLQNALTISRLIELVEDQFLRFKR